MNEATLAMRMLEICRDSGATMHQSICALNLAVTLVPVIFKPVSPPTPGDDGQVVALTDEMERLKVERVQTKH